MNDIVEIKLSSILSHIDILQENKILLFPIEYMENLSEKDSPKIIKYILDSILKNKKISNYFNLNSQNLKDIKDLDENEFNELIEIIVQKNIEYRNTIDFMLFLENDKCNFENSEYVLYSADYGDILDQLDSYQKNCKRKKIFPTFFNFKYWVWDKVVN